MEMVEKKMSKKRIQRIKDNVERTIQGLQTKPQEFIYERTGGFVKPNMLYSVYYTLSKKEVYLTGLKGSIDSKIIKKIKNKTMYSEYYDLTTAKRTSYPQQKSTKPSKSD